MNVCVCVKVTTSTATHTVQWRNAIFVKYVSGIVF
jgi:hypothetical protein